MEQIRLLHIIPLFGSLFFIVRCEIFASTAQLKDAVIGAKVKNREMKEFLRSYIAEQLEHMERAERLIQELHDLSGDEIKDPMFKITHPFNAYRFIRNHSEIFNSSLMKTVTEISSFENETSTLWKSSLTNLTKDLPTMDDINGTVQGFQELQQTYSITSKKFADGTFTKTSLSNLTAGECADVSAVLQTRGLHAAGLEWLQEAINRTHKENGSTANIERVLRVSAKSALKARNHFAALMAINEGLPKYAHRKTRLLANRIKSGLEEFRQTATPKEIAKQKRKADYRVTGFPIVNRLCSGQEVDLGNSLGENHLFCRYETNGDPSLMLQPLQYEQLSSSPYIAVYHDAFSDQDIHTLIENSKDKLERSYVGDGYVVPVRNGRISASTRVYHNITKINNKIKMITSLQAGGESAKVSNYGVGGFYEPHFDAYDNEVNNRIATFMVYMSDVEMGGATIFPKANITIFPKKGTAVFWRNMYRNVTIMDRKSLHAACPVIKGDKWVGTFGIREVGQEFIWPCTLNEFE